jgi:hypothetical protein
VEQPPSTEDLLALAGALALAVRIADRVIAGQEAELKLLRPRPDPHPDALFMGRIHVPEST